MKPIRMGIVGTSKIAAKAAQAMHLSEGLTPVAVLSRKAERGEDFRCENGLERAFTSAAEFRDFVDAVYVASPNSLHCQQTCFFLKGGRDVLCEKPAASNLREVRQMLAAAKKNGTVLMEAWKTRYLPAYRLVSELIPQLGTVRDVRLSFARYSSRYDAHKAGMNVNTFLNEYSNGALLDMGVYALYPLLDWFGMPSEYVGRGFLLDSGVDGSTCVLCSYDGFLARVDCSKVADCLQKSEICGEDGTLTFDTLCETKTLTLTRRDGSTETFSPERNENEMVYEMEEFARRVCERTPADEAFLTQSFSLLDGVRKQIGLVYPADGTDF